MARTDIDFENLTIDDKAYFDQRPWLKTEYERITGNKFDDLEFPSEDEDDSDEDEQDAGNTNPDDPEDEDPEDDEDDEAPDYAAWDYNDLKKELGERNADRDEEDKIVPESMSAESIVAALEADDEEAEE